MPSPRHTNQPSPKTPTHENPGNQAGLTATAAEVPPDEPTTSVPSQEAAAIETLKAIHASARQAREAASGIERPRLDYEYLGSRFLGRQEWAPLIRAIVDTVFDYRAGHIPMGRGANRREALKRAAKAMRSVWTNMAQIDLRLLVAAMAEPGTGQSTDAPDAVHAAAEAGASDQNGLLPPTQPILLDEVLLFLGLLQRMSAGLIEVADNIDVVRARPRVADPLSLGCEMLCDRWRAAYGTLPAFSTQHGSIGDFALQLFGPSSIGFSDAEVTTAMKRALQAAKAVNVTVQQSPSADGQTA